MKDLRPIYLVVTGFFPSKESFRGPFIYDQVKAIERDGRFRVVVLKPTLWYKKEKDYIYDGIPVYRFICYETPSNAWPGLGDFFSCVSFNQCLSRLNIKYEDIGVVHAHVTELAKYANFVKQKNPKVISVLQHHGYDVLELELGRFSESWWHKKLCIRYGLKQCNQIDLHLGVSKTILNYLESYDGISLKRKYVLYNGVDFRKFYPKKDMDKNAFFTIGCVANFWELKDQITLIKAVERLVLRGMDNLRVKFVGTGQTRSKCEQYVQEKGLMSYFEFYNEVDHTCLIDFYNTLNLFVLPSYWDSFGCVYVEAYACGIPFITAEGTGIVELIAEDERDKWVISPQNDKQLSLLIENFIEKRYNQTLNTTIDIDALIKQYIDYLFLLIDNELYTKVH